MIGKEKALSAGSNQFSEDGAYFIITQTRYNYIAATFWGSIVEDYAAFSPPSGFQVLNDVAFVVHDGSRSLAKGETAEVGRSRKYINRAIEHECCGIHQLLVNAIKSEMEAPRNKADNMRTGQNKKSANSKCGHANESYSTI
ncbi:hypothetical protein Tco_1099334 [Tanacetum coccineum]